MRLPDIAVLWSGPSSVVWFIGGILTAQMWQWVKAKWKDFKEPEYAPHAVRVFNTFWVAIAVSFAMMLWIMAKTEKTYDYTKQLDDETKACQREFNTAVKAQREVADSNFQLLQQREKATTEWIHDLIMPPAKIAALDLNDPARSVFNVDRTNQVLGVWMNVQREWDQNQEKYRAHPIPDPRCGNR